MGRHNFGLGLRLFILMLWSSTSLAQFGDIDVEGASSRYSQASDEYDARNSEHVVVVQRWNEAQNNLQSAKNRLNSIENEIAEIKTKADALESFLKRVDWDIERLKREIQRLQSLKLAAQEELRTAEQNLYDKNNELAQIRERLYRLEQELKHLVAQSSYHEIREHENKLTRLRTEKSTAEREAKRLGDRARFLVSENSRLQVDIESNQSEMRRKRQRAKELRDEWQQLKDARAPQIAERERIRQKTPALNARLKRIRDRIRELEQEQGNENAIRRLKAEQREINVKKDKIASDIERITRKVAKEDNRRQTIWPMQARLDQEADRLKSENQSNRQKIAQNRTEAQRLRSQRDEKLGDIQRRIEPEIDRTESRLSELRREERDLDEQIAELKRRIAEMRRKEQNVNSQIASLHRRILNLKSEIKDLTRRIQILERQIMKLREDKRRAKIELERINRLLPGLEAERDRLMDAVRIAQFDFNAVDEERRTSEQILAVALDKKRGAKNYLDEVRANLDRAQAAARQKGRDLAKDHGANAAGKVNHTGSLDGKRSGFNVGASKGAAEQPALSFYKGFQAARSNPDSQSSAYVLGIQKGENHADTKAKAEIFPVGFNDAMKIALSSVPENDEVVDLSEDEVGYVEYESTLLDTTPKTVGSVSAPSLETPESPRYELPRMSNVNVPSVSIDRSQFSDGDCASFPTTALDSLCKQTYASSYDQSFLAAYENLYKSAFTSSFASSSRDAYKAARDDVDQTIFTRGASEANLQTGLINGFEKGLAAATVKQRELGEKAFMHALDSHYFASIDGLTVRDQNQDGLLSPNETMSLELSINNFGALSLPTGSLKIEIVKADAITTEKSFVLLPAVSSNSRTTFKAVLPGVVKTTAAAESSVAVKMLWIDEAGKETTLGQSKVEIDVKFPIELKDIKFGSAVQAGENGEMFIVLRNQSRIELEIESVNLSLDARIGMVQKSDIPLVPPGETVEVPIGFVPNVGAGSNQTFPFELTLKNVAGLADLTQIYNKAVPLKRKISMNLCINGFSDCESNYIMPVKVKAGQAFNIPFLLKLHVPDAEVRGVSYRVERESASSGVKFQNNSLLGFTRTNLNSRNPEKNMFKVYIPSNVPRGSKEMVTFSLKEKGTVIHSLTIPIEVM